MLRLLYVLIAVLVIGSVGAAYLLFDRDQRPVLLTIGAGPIGSDSYDLMKEVAEVAARHSDRLQIKVRPTRDSSQNISLLNQGEVDLATIRSDTPVVSNVRLVAKLFPDYFQIVVRQDSGIHTVTDLRGRTMAIPPFGTDEFRSFWVIGDHYDLSVGSMQWRAIPFDLALEELMLGKVDALFTVRSLRDRQLARLHEDARLKRTGLRFIEIDQADAIGIKRPFLRAGTVPKGAFGGSDPTPSEDVTSAVVDRVLVSREDIDASAVRELTRVMFEQRLDLTIRFALASAITQPDVSQGLSVPLHDGATAYFSRDEPAFIQENAEPLALMVTVTAMLVSTFFALRGRLNANRKNRLDSYNYMLLDISEKARNSSSPEELKEFKNELYSVLETVVRAFDTDEVTEEGFQSFSLLWESVRESINDRQNELNAFNA
ncbi:MAG: TAXI family TRAP transporter solute-binding subunit [Pseudomonadota bacterium]